MPKGEANESNMEKLLDMEKKLNKMEEEVDEMDKDIPGGSNSNMDQMIDA